MPYIGHHKAEGYNNKQNCRVESSGSGKSLTSSGTAQYVLYCFNAKKLATLCGNVAIRLLPGPELFY